jgi:parallel beta-helix repeat protein
MEGNILKKILTTCIIFILMSTSLFLIKAETTGPSTIYVDDDNTEGPWEGTLENPYNFIQDAIDHASRGDTISVFNGLYKENILVRVSISIIGEDKNNTIVYGNGRNDVFNISADNVEITKFTIQNSGKKRIFDKYEKAGIKIRANYASIHNNIINDNKGHGIAVYYLDLPEESIGSVIEKNSIVHNGQHGIYAISTDGLRIINNTIQYNIDGVVMSVLSSCYVLDNLIMDNEDYGIFAQTNVKDCVISLNVIENHKSKAISLISENTIINNNHISGSMVGIDLFKEWRGSSNYIRNNNILNCEKCGFFEHYRFNDAWYGIPNCWENNYYGISHDKPMFIFGKLLGFDRIKFIPWIEIDWHPATEPYDIEV